MRLTNPDCNQWFQTPGIDGMFAFIEKCARVCYQSTPAKKAPKEFVEDILIKNDHGRPLEFGTVYLTYKAPWGTIPEIVNFYDKNPYSRVVSYSYQKSDDGEDLKEWYITTNYRVIVEHHRYDDLQYWSEPTKHLRRYTMNYIISRGCSDDLRTHITLSSLAESTRFCNYSLGKFGSELTFIKPYWFGENDALDQMFIKTFEKVEEDYMYYCLSKLQPQQMKRILPLGIKTQLLLCGFLNDWDNFFYRRCDTHADPECQYLANETRKILKVTV